MNRAKWQSRDVPLEIIALKLTEEVGEVANEITDRHFDRADPSRFKRRITEELEHVEFLARTMRERIQDMT